MAAWTVMSLPCGASWMNVPVVALVKYALNATGNVGRHREGLSGIVRDHNRVDLLPGLSNSREGMKKKSFPCRLLKNTDLRGALCMDSTPLHVPTEAGMAPEPVAVASL